MKTLLALIIGIAIGAAALYFYNTQRGKSLVQNTGAQIESGTRAARDAVQQKVRDWNLSSDNIKAELEKTGQVVRRRANEAGTAISDATADARTTAAIKTKLVGSKELSAMRISVNTTAGVVTLSGSVNTAEDIGKAILLAMETEGVREVISTLQVIPPKPKAN